MSKQKEIASNPNDILTAHPNESYKNYIENITTPSLSNTLGKYTTQKLITDQSANTN